MKEKIREIMWDFVAGEVTDSEAVQQVLDLFAVSVSLRDYIATECMKSEIIAWNKEMSNEYRAKLLEDMIERYGNIKVNDAIALMSYEMADAMLSARSTDR